MSNVIAEGVQEMGKSASLKLSTVTLDRDTIPQADLNISAKVRANLFPWTGQFSPQLVEVLLKRFASKGHVVLDPFAGSGTVLAEAGRLGIAAYGVELNPAAYCLARTYEFINLRKEERERSIELVDTLLSSQLNGNSSRQELETVLHRKYTAMQDAAGKRLFETFLLLLDYKYRDFDALRLQLVWSRLQNTVRALPFSKAPVKMLNADARKLSTKSASVDLILSSPPYINVFNYHQQYRASTESLGWNLLDVARSEIGANRKYRGNRFLTVVQYILDMDMALREFIRVLKPSGRLILIVGRESNVMKTPFFNAEILANVATRCLGFTIERRQERMFANRFGLNISEDILHFNLPAKNFKGETPYTIADETLRSALKRVPMELKDALECAIQYSKKIPPSPIYSVQGDK